MVYNLTPILQHHNQHFKSCYVSSKASAKSQHTSLFSLPSITPFIPNKAVKVLKLQVNSHSGLCFTYEISPHLATNLTIGKHIYTSQHIPRTSSNAHPTATLPDLYLDNELHAIYATELKLPGSTGQIDTTSCYAQYIITFKSRLHIKWRADR